MRNCYNLTEIKSECPVKFEETEVPDAKRSYVRMTGGVGKYWCV